MLLKLVLACATVAPPQHTIGVAQEEVLLVWDDKAKRQHLMRRLDFDASQDFGFLVPVPSRPEVSEADDAAFDKAAEIFEAARPRVVNRHFSIGSGLVLAPSRGAKVPPLAAAAVQVLETKRVAGMDATVLEATDPEALARWLGERGFDSRPSLRDWLRPYLERKFIIVAFKYVAGEVRRVGAKAVDLAFDTPRPFFPYREPDDAQRTGTFRVWFLGPQVKGVLGEEKVPWSAAVKLAIAGRQVTPNAPEGARVMLFEESVSRRPAAGDLFFEPDAVRDVLPEPLVIEEDVEIPCELGCCGFLLIAVVVFVLRRRNKRA